MAKLRSIFSSNEIAFYELSSLTMMSGGSRQRRMFWTDGCLTRAIKRLRMRDIFRLAIVNTAPNIPPMKPSNAAGKNMMTLTGIVLPSYKNL
jgi:hypothetical protein